MSTVNKTPISNMTDTWESGSSDTSIKMNVTDNGAVAGANLIDLQIGGTSKFKVDKDGNIVVPGSITASAGGSGPEFADNVFRVVDNADNTKELAFEVSGITTGTTRTLTAFDADDTIVGLAATQTLTNKTLTSPTLTSPTINTSVALPAGAVDAITEIDASLKSGSDGTLITGTAGTASDLAIWNGDGDLVDGPTPPSGTIVGTSDTQTLTNKTLTAPAINTAVINGGSIGATTAITSLDVDNININGNVISSTDTNGTIDLTPDGTGDVNITNVDISSGEIDGTTIGANSASTGAFTTLSASGVATFAASGTAGAPSLTFSADTDCGIYRSTTNVWAMSANSVEHIRLDGANSRVGFFQTSPQYEVDVTGDVNLTGSLYVDANQVVGSQQTTGVAEATFVENAGGTAVNVDSTFGGYTLQQVVQALQNHGLLA